MTMNVPVLPTPVPTDSVSIKSATFGDHTPALQWTTIGPVSEEWKAMTLRTMANMAVAN